MMGIRRLTATGPRKPMLPRAGCLFREFGGVLFSGPAHGGAGEQKQGDQRPQGPVAFPQPGRPILFALHKNLLLMEIRRLSPLYRIFREEKGVGYCQSWQERPTVPAGRPPCADIPGASLGADARAAKDAAGLQRPWRGEAPALFPAVSIHNHILPAPTPPRTDKSTGRRRCPRSGRRPPPNRWRGRRRGSRRRGRGGAPPGPG